jgi:hypothetical protein
MPGFTDHGLYLLFDYFFRGGPVPSTFAMALCTSVTVPSALTNTLADLSEVLPGNGYTSGGAVLSRSATTFPALLENTVDARAELQLAPVAWTATGGNLPATQWARYAVLTTDGTPVSSRAVLFWWDLGEDRQVFNGQTMTLSTLEIRGVLPVGVTVRGMARAFDAYFRGQGIPPQFYTALSSAAHPPTTSTATLSDLAEVAVGNGYGAGGLALPRDSSGFPASGFVEEDQALRVSLTLRDVVWTATGGSLPAAIPARYLSLLDADPVPATRDVLAWWDLQAPVQVTSGNTITVRGMQVYGLSQ